MHPEARKQGSACAQPAFSDLSFPLKVVPANNAQHPRTFRFLSVAALINYPATLYFNSHQRFDQDGVFKMFSSGGYGRFSGRGRAGCASTPRGGQGWRSTPEVPRTPSPPLGPVLTKILHKELDGEVISLSTAKITDVQDVASYNWVKANEPTIMVPGKCLFR